MARHPAAANADALPRGGLVRAWLLAGALAGCDQPVPAHATADMAGTAAAGVVGGRTLVYELARAAPDTRCGQRGVAITLLATGADGAAGGDGGAGAGELTVWLSDRLPGIYSFGGPVSCNTVLGRRRFDALAAGLGVRARGGVVVLGRAGPDLAGTLDVLFDPGGEASGFFEAASAP